MYTFIYSKDRERPKSSNRMEIISTLLPKASIIAKQRKIVSGVKRIKS